MLIDQSCASVVPRITSSASRTTLPAVPAGSRHFSSPPVLVAGGCGVGGRWQRSAKAKAGQRRPSGSLVVSVRAVS